LAQRKAIPSNIRQEVLELRRTHSQREVAELTGLSIGTIKTIIARSGAFRDNPTHRALFSLPPVKESTQILPATVQSPPLPRRVTCDAEVDAVLWLRKVIETGDESLIGKARIAFGHIKTPLSELQERYTRFMQEAQPGNLLAGLLFTQFDEIDRLAQAAINKAALRREAYARLGDKLEDTPAEQFCLNSLRGLEPESMGFLSNTEVADRFKVHTNLMPQTLNDCLHELAYWNHLYRLRNAADPDWQPYQEVDAREIFTFSCMALIRPRSTEEAVSVLRFMADNGMMGQPDTDAILMNLVGNR